MALMLLNLREPKDKYKNTHFIMKSQSDVECGIHVVEIIWTGFDLLANSAWPSVVLSLRHVLRAREEGNVWRWWYML